MIATALRIVAVTATLGIGIAAASAQSAEPARPQLKTHVTVNANIVRIGDLIDNAGIVADVAIFRAPDLGTTGTVPVAAVVEAVRPHALVGFDTGGATEITVTRAAREIPISEIERSLAEAVSSRFNAGPAADITVTFDRDPRAIQVDPSSRGDIAIARLSYDARSSRFDATLEIPTGATQRGLLRLSGRAYATAEVVMVSHSVDRGAVLRAADLQVERRPRAEVGRDAIVGIERAIGMAARSVIRPGQPLRSADLTRPEIVQRGQMVTLVFEAPGLTLTLRGKATEAGAEGDTVTVLNEQSKRSVQGVVVGPGHVVVSTTVPRFAANLPAAAGTGP
ncbi:flagellar basal body P-ring formation chaperone FlgA [Undibacter mobilis]|uniref:Flagella basal body P-ring formation protein FlgA n=1 Tax=Undibacter mobilis TaxID=2292256 RepID=A0A371BC96_9BRAD|nr:flagellar basal body P-ring formation chaperone FlgA [Undibacter mobilis]RDV05192.1 flagella basal body P-ring formation protein FlgA [Undibacter mobilis]